MLCCSRMSLEYTTENRGLKSGPFIEWYSRKTIYGVNRLGGSGVKVV